MDIGSTTARTVGGASGAAQGRSAGSTGSAMPGGDLGEDAFLKLLVAQLKNQNPLAPMQDKDFMSQVAQFRILEQLDRLNETMAYQAGVQGLAQGSALLGKEVVAQAGGEGPPVVGAVSGVSLQNGEVVLTVDDQWVYLSDVVEIRS